MSLAVAAPGLAQTLNCADFWNAGSPVSPDPFDHPCTELAAPATVEEIRAFVPVEWSGPEPSVERLLDTLGFAAEAAEAFRRYGEIPQIYILFTDRDSMEVTGRRLFASVETRLRWAELLEPCPMVVYPEALEKSEEGYKQAIAHEVFHCFQSENLPDQLQAEGIGWWMEGSATYFINAPYPMGDLEHRPARTYDHLASLFYQTGPWAEYSTTGFFQSLAGSVGREGIVSFLASLPASGGLGEQMDAVARYPEMQTLWHLFGQQILDDDLDDDGGGTVPIASHKGDVMIIDELGRYELEANPFTAQSDVLEFPGGFSYSFEIREEGAEGRYSVRPEGGKGGWSELRSPIEAPRCTEPLRYQLLTTTTADPTEQFLFVLEVTERRPNPRCCGQEGAVEPELVGVWIARPDDIARRIYPQATGGTTLTGSMSVTIESDGTFVHTYDGIRATARVNRTNLSDATDGTVSGCLTTEDLGKPTVRYFTLANRSTSVSRIHTNVPPHRAAVRTDEAPLGLTWGVPEGDEALGILEWVAPDAFLLKGVHYERKSEPPDE